MGFIYKRATIEDKAGILELAKEYHAEEGHHYKDIEFDEVYIDGVLTHALTSEYNYIVLCCLTDINRNEHIVGGLWGYMTPQLFTPELFATDAFTYVDPLIRGCGIGKQLLDCFEHWAKEKGCHAMRCGAMSGINNNVEAEQMYITSGYKEAGKAFLKPLK